MEDGYYAWMIVATALVLMMTTPALAFFYGGMTRTKSTLNMMMMSFTAMGVVGITFVLWGWSIGWGADGIGNGNGKLIASPANTFGLLHVSSSNFVFVTWRPPVRVQHPDSGCRAAESLADALDSALRSA